LTNSADDFVLIWWIQFGQNVIFLVFPAKDEDGKNLIDPLKEGRFAVDENNHTISWRLPSTSLLPEQILRCFVWVVKSEA